MLAKKWNSPVVTAAQVLLIYVWLTDLSALVRTNTYYSVNLLCGIFALLCLWDNRTGGQKHPPLLWIPAGLFSLAVVLGNHEIYEPLSIQNRLNVVMDLLGGLCVGDQILWWMLRRLPLHGQAGTRNHPRGIFWGSFALMAAVDFGFLLAWYPGFVSQDTLSAIRQVLSNSYSNDLPYYHTRLMGIFLKLGMALTGDLNFGIALYHGCQILFLTAVLAFALTTLYQIGIPKWALWLTFFVYGFLPYNIVYSVTLWKDVPFGASVLLLATAFYRLLKHVGKARKWDCFAFTLGAVGMALMRTNGWFALLAAAVLMAIVLRKQDRQLTAVLLAVLTVTWVLLHPVLNALNVPGTNPAEAFSVPMQQIARVVANGRELTQEQQELLGKIFLLDRLEEDYIPYLADPVKFGAFRSDQVEQIRQNSGQYLKLYLSLGLRYPGDYLKAWVDQTRGYWNGGYDYWVYLLQSKENDLGVILPQGANPLGQLYATYFRFADKPTALQCLHSIGLQIWILVACCIVCCLQKRKQWLITVPALVLTIGLWLGTPVYCEFRYAYPMVLCTPLVLLTTVFEPKPESKL